ncbi:PREDICTED: protein disulfide isomerase-like 1-5 isoform X1 [Brassica oleracea var. oleracea]|uniref:protein disulfide isomerase-like 1-5 isoform X1 n=2 Tax=Brassica oleracea var. oleracea TaxID=109376 RepID=UPI0006A6DF5C|nr:PREDICTED: protein disulfide isomerase-like 1-5 isoform X1 [Brassica oleracea var. oleracea]XP_013606446.1 PREDICTED: protein disulfide isomerase-like 1-5 isoform X1 [Brassica oleracea var. oleracea]
MTYNGVNGVVKLLFPELKASDVFIGMVKTKAERYTKYGKLAADCGRPFLLIDGSYKMEKILEFLGKKKFPLIKKSSESNTAWVYSTPIKLQVMIFAKADDFQSMAPPLEDIARRFKSKLMFIYIDITKENLAMPFLTLFGIEDANKTVDAVLKEKCKIDLCVVRITGSSNMFEGINLSRCSELMK